MSMSGNAFSGSSAGASGGMSGGGNMFGGMPSGMPPGLMQLLQGLFAHSDRPFGDAERAYDEHTQPWINAGRNAINPFSQRINEMGNGRDFTNGIMNDYQESPYARYQQQQGINSANALGSANGLSGSTSLTDFAQRNAQDISGKDQQQYFNNRMGVNQGYLGGLNSLMSTGSQFDANAAPWAGDVAAGKSLARNQDQMNTYQGGANLASSIIQMLMMG